MSKNKWVIYLVRCSDESLYCGITNHLEKRLTAHNLGKGAKYTRSRRPVELVAAVNDMTKSDALKMEYRIKRVSSDKKIYELKKGKVKTTMNLKKELQKVNGKINAIAKMIDKLISATEEPEKAKPKPAKGKSVKKDTADKPVAKKPVKLTTADTVLGIIKKSKNGVNTAAIMEKTGFNSASIYNIVSKLKKQGKVKTVGKGMYVMA